MNKIEVDPKLFIKCRLCLDETGHYQISPNVQMQIKYCFDIDVEPFDGLPQLVCKKCESILSQYSGIKQIFQEKQKNIKSRLSSNVKTDNIIQQQQDIVSSTQADIENRNKIDELTKCNRKTPVPTRLSSTETVLSNFSQSHKRKTILGNKTNKAWESTYIKYFVCRYCAKNFKDKKSINNHIRKWCKFYTKYSKMNKACLVSLNKIGSKINLTGTIDNVVFHENKIIQSREATYYILYTKKPNGRCDSSDSSDDDFIFEKKKRKRQRLLSGSSNETVVIDHNTGKKSDDEKLTKARKPEKNKNTQFDSDIECLDIEDSDSNSTKSSVKTKDFESETPHYKQTKTINDKMVHNIIAMCSNKYINRLNSSDGGLTNKGREESSLKHKILSIGTKVIHSKGINTIGLLRYMEHKNLDVIWVPKMDTKVTIKARLRDSGDSFKSLGWENITSVPNHSYVLEDFADIYRKKSEIENHINENIEDNQVPQVTQCQGNSKVICQEGSALMNLMMEFEAQSGGDKPVPVNMPTCVDTSESKVNDNNSYLRAVLDADRNWTKLLNANPVANPKQLPKKNTFNEPASIVKIYSDEPKNDAEVVENSNTENNNEMLHMPIITSTVSLAPPVNTEQPNVCSNQNANEMNKEYSVSSKPQSKLPKIKVKPVSELMSDEALSQQNTSSFVATTGWAVNHESQRQNVVLQPNDTNLVYMTNPPFTNIISVQQDFVYYTQRQDIEVGGVNPTVSQSGSNQAPKQKEYVKLHTVELPNTRTDSPYRYFQKLLQMHNILLLDSLYAISNSMKCLMKFKVVFQQESISPVVMSLCFFCENNVFCIKARDPQNKEIDLSKFSANWQWEILKVFKGDDIVPKLFDSAMKFGNPLYNYTNYFINLLRSIVFTKES